MAINNQVKFFIFVIILGSLIYSNSLTGDFLFDDKSYIVNNYIIRSLTDIKPIWEFPGCKGRFIALYSFALNYYFGGLNPFGYHVVNLVVHLINALLVWRLVNLILATPKLIQTGLYKNYIIIPIITALIFLTHPLQTQTVTYITQRFASLATLFYLLALCLYIKGRLVKKNSLIFYSIVSTIFGMFNKEILFTIPFMVIIIELYFFNLLKRIFTIRKQILFLYLLAVLILILLIPFLFDFNIKGIVLRYDILSESHNGDTITWINYFITQFRVLIRYLKLFFIPVGLNLDYDFVLSKSIFETATFLSLIGLVLIFSFAFIFFKSFPLISFGIIWFFLTSSVESSIIPIRHVIFEHRMYLPLIGLSLGVAELIAKLIRNYRKQIIVTALISIILGFLTYERNKVWQNNVTLWQDVVKKSPNKSRGYMNLGVGYFEKGEIAKAKENFIKSLELSPNSSMSYNGLGLVYQVEGNLSEALNAFNKALELNPGLDEIYTNRGALYRQLSKYDLALADLNESIKRNPYQAESYNNRALVYREIKEKELALADLKKALSLKTNYAEAYNNFGIIYEEEGNYQLALEQYNKAISIDQYYIKAYNNRAVVYKELGKNNLALTDLNRVIEKSPSTAEVYNNRGNVYKDMEKYDLAILDYDKAISIDPKYAEAYNNRAVIYKRINNYEKALSDFNKAIEIKLDYTVAYNNRGNLYTNIKKYNYAVIDYSKAIEINKNFAPAYLGRAVAYEGMKEYEKALSDLKSAKNLGSIIDEKYILRLQMLSKGKL